MSGDAVNELVRMSEACWWLMHRSRGRVLVRLTLLLPLGGVVVGEVNQHHPGNTEGHATSEECAARRRAGSSRGVHSGYVRVSEESSVYWSFVRWTRCLQAESSHVVMSVLR
jgi:hypothetical protein